MFDKDGEGTMNVGFREAFTLFDKDGDGTMDEEFKETLPQAECVVMNVHMPMDQVVQSTVEVPQAEFVGKDLPMPLDQVVQSTLEVSEGFCTEQESL